MEAARVDLMVQGWGELYEYRVLYINFNYYDGRGEDSLCLLLFFTSESRLSLAKPIIVPADTGPF